MFRKKTYRSATVKGIGDLPLLSWEEEKALGLRAMKGDVEAQHQLVCANLPLVAQYVSRYSQRFEFEDLFQAGTMGLMRAASDFNPVFGYRFATYALHWVRQHVNIEMNNGQRLISVPPRLVTAVGKTRKAREQFEVAEGRKPTEAEELNFGTYPVNARYCFRLAEAVVNFTGGTGGTEGSSQGGPLGEGDFCDSNDDSAHVSRFDLADTLAHHSRFLGAREKYVLKRRFGLDGMGQATLEEVGKDLGTTRERARQIEDRALRKLHKSFLHYV